MPTEQILLHSIQLSKLPAEYWYFHRCIVKYVIQPENAYRENEVPIEAINVISDHKCY